MKCIVLVYLLALCGGAFAGSFTLGPYTFAFNSNSAAAYSLANIEYFDTSVSTIRYDSTLQWFSFYVNDYPLPAGGLPSVAPDFAPDGSYTIVNFLTSSFRGLDIYATVKSDIDSWVISLLELYNPISNPTFNPTLLSNYQRATSNGGDLFIAPRAAVFASSSSDTTIDTSDSWFVLQQGGSFGPINNVIAAFGDSGELFNLELYDSGLTYNTIRWVFDAEPIEPGETLSFLSIMGIVPFYFVPNGEILPKAALLNNAASLYQARSSSGHRLLDHLTSARLGHVVNWNFANGGVGGDPHGINFDGSQFEIPNIFGTVYCLFHDRDLQVNFAVGKHGFIEEIVVLARLHGISIHARFSADGTPEYVLDGEVLQVPISKLEGLVSTHWAPLGFHEAPLNELERYHMNGLTLRGQVSIVGGIHPQAGSFFNVAVHRHPTENEFPAVLQLPFLPERDTGFTASMISDVWFDLQ